MLLNLYKKVLEDKSYRKDILEIKCLSEIKLAVIANLSPLASFISFSVLLGHHDLLTQISPNTFVVIIDTVLLMFRSRVLMDIHFNEH